MQECQPQKQETLGHTVLPGAARKSACARSKERSATRCFRAPHARAPAPEARNPQPRGVSERRTQERLRQKQGALSNTAFPSAARKSACARSKERSATRGFRGPHARAPAPEARNPQPHGVSERHAQERLRQKQGALSHTAFPSAARKSACARSKEPSATRCFRAPCARAPAPEARNARPHRISERRMQGRLRHVQATLVRAVCAGVASKGARAMSERGAAKPCAPAAYTRAPGGEASDAWSDGARGCRMQRRRSQDERTPADTVCRCDSPERGGGATKGPRACPIRRGCRARERRAPRPEASFLLPALERAGGASARGTVRWRERTRSLSPWPRPASARAVDDFSRNLEGSRQT